MTSHNDRHNPQDMQTLGRGFPDTLKLFQIPASRFWYVGMYLKGRGFVRKSTRCERLSDAREFAADWYEERVTESEPTKRQAVYPSVPMRQNPWQQAKGK